MIAEAPLHLLRRLEVAVGEALAAEAEIVDRAFVADRGDDVLEHSFVGRIVEHVAGGEGPDAVAFRHGVESVEPGRIARPAAVGEGEMGAVAEHLPHLGERGFGGGVGFVGD